MASKRQAESSAARPTKKPRTDEASDAAPKSVSQPKQVFTSALVADEVDFPRGGGTSLKPIELKEARDEGKREVEAELAEEKQKKRAAMERRNKKNGKAVETGGKEKKVIDKDEIRVEHLSYKRLVPGTKLLARVHSILQLHIILSLPNQLLAHVPITEISPAMTTLLTQGENSDDDEEMEDREDEETAPPDLAQIFYPGQYVTTSITEVFATGTSSKSFSAMYPPTEHIRLAGRLEATLHPDKVNDGVARLDLEKGYKIQGSLKAEEDHGWVVDLGMKDLDGFLAKDKAGGRPLFVGQIVDTVIDSLAPGSRLAQLTLDQKAISRAILSEASTVASVLPGHLVMGLITAVMPSGLNIRICGFFDGTIDLTHLGIGKAEVEDCFKVGKKIKARIINDNLATTPKRFGLSVLPHILALESPKSSERAVAGLETEFGVGTVMENVEVIRVDKEFGLVGLTLEGHPAYIHINHLADERPPTLSGSTGTWRVGTKHTGRVIGHSPFDGTILLSFAPKVLAQRFMMVSEVKVGEVIKGTVTKLSDRSLFVNISGSVDGVAWPHHYADIQLKHPEKRFRPGGSVKCRVFAIEPEKNRIKLTLKKSLVESKHDVPASFEEIKVGMITPAVVTKVFEKGCLVELFGGSSAFISSVEASDSFVKNMSDVVFTGKPINMRVLAVDAETRRVTGSIRQASASFAERQSLAVGDVVTGIVTEIHADQVVLILHPSEAKAILSLSKLAHHRDVKIAALKASLAVGERMDDLQVVVKNESTGLLIVTNKKTTATTASGVSGTGQPQVLQLGSLQSGQIVPGRIASKDDRGYWVRVTKTIRGRVAMTDLADDYEQLGPGLEANSEVSCCVINVDEKAKRLDLSMRPSRVNMAGSSSSTVVADPEIEGLTSLKTGQKIRGFVSNVATSGLYVALGRALTARVMIRELFDDFVSDWQDKFTVGQLVEGKILNVDLKNERIEMTLRQKASGKEKKKKTTLGLADFAVDQKIEGLVKKIEPYGMFLRIDGTTISGLCHRSEISDDPAADVQQALSTFRAGDRVRAKITAIDGEKNKVSFGIKPSYFEDADFQPINGDNGDVDMDSHIEQSSAVEGSIAEDHEDEADEEDEEEDSDGAADEDDDMLDNLPDSDEEEEMLLGDDADEEEDEDEDDTVWPESAFPTEQEEAALEAYEAATSNKGDKKDIAKRSALSAGFDWDGGAAINEADESDSESDDEELDGQPEPTKSKKRKSNAPYQDLTADVHTKTPESTAEFERALLASPNASLLWIQYMAFQLELSEVGKARDIGRRALAKIAFREEAEKLNVWMALLNLENAHGTPESFEKVFREAVQYNDAKTVYLRTGAILLESEKFDAAEEIYRRGTKKFGDSLELWAKFGEFYFLRNDLETARALLPRTLKSLPNSEHVRIIERFAIFEFKHGEPERGKTIYEGLVDRYPKLLYIWNNYVDQVAKQGDIQSVRGLIDRALDQKLKPRQAKFLFKKLLSVETRIGDAAGQDKAKAKAREWVLLNAGGVGGALAAAPVEESEEESDEEEE